MNSPDPRIIKFIRRHHVLTLATLGEKGPWCSNIFYAYSEQDNLFFFTSDETTRHGAEGLKNSTASGSIVLETKIVGRVQGLQLSGKIYRLRGEKETAARKAYIRRFPYAAVAELTMWSFEPLFLKLTDNTLGFGKKLLWHKDENTAKKS